MASPSKQQYQHRYRFRKLAIGGLVPSDFDFTDQWWRIPECPHCGGKGTLFAFQPDRYRCRSCVAKAVAQELWR